MQIDSCSLTGAITPFTVITGWHLSEELTLLPEKPTNSSSLSVRVGNMEIICRRKRSSGMEKLATESQSPFFVTTTPVVCKQIQHTNTYYIQEPVIIYVFQPTKFPLQISETIEGTCANINYFTVFLKCHVSSTINYLKLLFCQTQSEKDWKLLA